MATSASLDVLPLWLMFAGSFACLLAAVEVGHRLGRWRRARVAQEKEGPIGGIVAAELGLLAFLLAFAFGIAASRFDERRQVLLDEVNAIGTTYLRAPMLPQPHRGTTEATAVVEKDVRSIPAGLFVESLNERIDLPAKRLQVSVRSRLPVTVWGVLFTIAVL